MQPALFFEPEPVPRLPGPAVGLRGRKSTKIPRPDLSSYPPQGLPSPRSVHGQGRALPKATAADVAGGRPTEPAGWRAEAEGIAADVAVEDDSQ